MAEEKSRYTIVCERSLIEEFKMLAKDYQVSTNVALILMMEDAVESWGLPNMEVHPRPMEVDEERQHEKDLT